MTRREARRVTYGDEGVECERRVNESGEMSAPCQQSKDDVPHTTGTGSRNTDQSPCP